MKSNPRKIGDLVNCYDGIDSRMPMLGKVASISIDGDLVGVRHGDDSLRWRHWKCTRLLKQKNERVTITKETPVTFGLNETAGKILEHFGWTPQTIKAMEELGECIAALSRCLNNPDDTAFTDYAAMEVADSIIMLAQMRKRFGERCVDEQIQIKLARTLEQIHGEKQS